MKTAKLVIGIITIVLSGIIFFQSCAVGIGSALEESEEVSGPAGMIVAVCMLVAGIISIATRNGKAGGFVAGGFYLVGGLIGIANVGSFGDLKIWSVLSLIFAAVLILGGILGKGKKERKEPENTQNGQNP